MNIHHNSGEMKAGKIVENETKRRQRNEEKGKK
jgi:hypothetical protein